MIHFLKLDNPSNSENYDKGVLFEKLCKIIIDAYGYEDIEMRVYKENLEYDVTAKNKLTGMNLIGEAKALQSKISQEIMVFIAKMLVHWEDDKNTLGLFLSVSELTAPVKGQIDKITKSHNIKYICGEDIVNCLAKHAGYLSYEKVKKIAQSITLKNQCGDTSLLITDRGEYYIQLLINDGETLPSQFCVLDKYGQLIKDRSFVDKIKEKIALVKTLEVYEETSLQLELNLPIVEVKNQSASFLGVLSGQGWFDYHFPTSPDKFIGREGAIDTFFKFVGEVKENTTKLRVFQILSRSGVGKSSLTLKLASEVNNQNDVTVVIDSRNIRNTIDILNIFQMIIKEVNLKYNQEFSLPSTSREVISVMQNVDQFIKSNNKIVVIFLDQFESVFQKTNIYNEILDIIFELNSSSSSFIHCIARKNDQPTTYDDSSQIDLEKLTSVSRKASLKDFNLEDSKRLIAKMTEEMGKPIIKQLKEQVLEISTGFPWLLKKYCAHIIKLVKAGHKQIDIYETGMQLEDLFEEELNSLDEVLREFFERLINFLPATYYEITETFDDTDLQYKLTALQGSHRLIRLTGKTYDTYNDVLKEYVKTGKILISKKYIMRLQPKGVLPFLKAVIDNEWRSTDEIIKSNNKYQRGSVYNRINELKRLELIEGSHKSFTVSSSAIKAYQDGTLNELLNAVFKKNALTKIISNNLFMSKTLTIEEVKNILKEEMSFIEASDGTWTNYARIYCAWLKVSGIVINKLDTISLIGRSTEVNITSINGDYIPTIYITQLERFLHILGSFEGAVNIKEVAKKMGRSSSNGMIAGAEFLELIRFHSRGVVELNTSGKDFCKMSKENKMEWVKKKILALRYVNEYLERIRQGMNGVTAFELFVKDIGFKNEWNETTVKWKHKLLRNWLSYSKLI